MKAFNSRTFKGESKIQKYNALIESLKTTGVGTMRCAGSSMLPILTNPSTCSYEVAEHYGVGDIVFCKVNGRYIDAHKITRIGPDGRYMISNNHGHDNGWTRTVYGRVLSARDRHGRLHYERQPDRQAPQ